MYVCTYVRTCVCMYECMYVRTNECMYICMYVYMYECMYVCMYACMYICMYVCMYGWMCVCMYECDNAIVKREILNLEKCLCDISVWMSQNKLKLNNDKTEIILFGSKKHLAELNIKSLSVAGTDVSVASEPVRNLGAMFDSQLIMAPHVKSVVKKSSFHLRNIGKARRVLTEDATKTVMQSLVMSRLDYCNALLIGIQQDLIAKLQRLQNSAARIVSRTRKYEHITPVLIKLHWLPIKFRIQFKVLLLVYKALNGLAPKYIKELLVPYKPRRHLRSEAKGLLDEPRTRLKFGDRAFSISAPRLWNALPQHLKDSTSCQAFKKCLKTHLFRLAHWGVVDYYSNYDNVQRFWTFYEWKRRYINSNYYYYYVCMYVRTYECMYICMYVCIYVCMYACMYVYMHVCMCVCMYGIYNFLFQEYWIWSVQMLTL